MALGTGEKKIDWGMAETLAYGTLLWEGHSIRLAGQDVERGTFSHRHAVLIDQSNEERYVPLNQLKEGQGRFYIYNSLLSEFAALGFEYGYSLSWPDGLTIWEAQFGDFANGAQVVIDQYLSSSEQKWGQKSNLTLFLPHGFEGQGPEHSSGRLERFLSLSAHDNMRVCYPTLPSQQFHLLRRQVLGKGLKPLIVLTPKGLLRLPACTSHWSDLVQGSFKEVLDDPDSPDNPHTLCFCSGKIYYDLKAYAEKYKEEKIAFIRIEQLYPLHMEAIKAVGAKYESAKRVIWAQEEPRNMGAWTYIHERLEKVLNQPLEFVGRDYSASPASGVYDTHRKEVAQIMEKVFSQRPTTYEISGQIKV
jgi:2-oxoglutarate dehydrogenase E1 component